MEVETATHERHQVTSKNDIMEYFDRYDTPRLPIKGNLNPLYKRLVNVIKNEIFSRRFTIVPIVEAAQPPPPEKPPIMRRSELPIDKKPHCDYNEYQDTLKLCPEFETKIINNMVYPYVCEYRRSIQEKAAAAYEIGVKGTKAVACAVSKAKNDFKEYMRAPENIQLRRTVTVSGVLTGFLSAYSKSIPKKLLFSGIGLLATGTMCFPKETDDGFRKFCYHLGAFLLNFANVACRQSWKFKWRGACKTVEDDSLKCEIKLGEGKLKK